MLRTQIKDALKTAMLAKDEIETSTLRLISAALKDRDIQARTSGAGECIPDAEILALLQSMVKQRRDSIELYEQGGRLELAEQEATEITIIERFLPQQLGDAEIEQAVAEVIEALDANSLKDMGKVMAELKSRYTGSMDFGKASGLVKARLGA